MKLEVHMVVCIGDGTYNSGHAGAEEAEECDKLHCKSGEDDFDDADAEMPMLRR